MAFSTQCDDGVDPHRAASRHVTGQARDRDQAERHGDERDGIGPRHRIQQAFHHPREPKAAPTPTAAPIAARDMPRPRSHGRLLPSMRPARDARRSRVSAATPGTPSHRTIQSPPAPRDEGERGQQIEVKSPRAERIIEQRIHRADGRQRHGGIDRASGGAHRVDWLSSATARPATSDSSRHIASRSRRTPSRHRLRGRTSDIAGDADDGVRLSPKLRINDRPPDRILVRKIPSRRSRR